MRTRLFLKAVEVHAGEGQDGDIPVERFFVNAGDLPEVWVDVEAATVPVKGRSVTFVLARDLGLGFTRITGTVERAVRK